MTFSDCPYGQDYNLFVFIFNCITFLIVIIFGILALYKQIKNQKIKPAHRLLYIFTIIFYLTVILYGFTLLINIFIFCNSTIKWPDAWRIFMFFNFILLDIHWLLLMMILFSR